MYSQNPGSFVAVQFDGSNGNAINNLFFWSCPDPNQSSQYLHQWFVSFPVWGDQPAGPFGWMEVLTPEAFAIKYTAIPDPPTE